MAVVTKENAIKHRDIPILEDWSSDIVDQPVLNPRMKTGINKLPKFIK